MLRTLLRSLTVSSLVVGVIWISVAYSYVGSYSYFYNSCDSGISAGIGAYPHKTNSNYDWSNGTIAC